MKKKRTPLPPLTPDFTRPTVRFAEFDCLQRRCTEQQELIDNLRRNCGEYRRLIKLLQNVEVLTPSHNPEPKEKR
jgi:hypothetical protein